jgi:hypothetical protein
MEDACRYKILELKYFLFLCRAKKKEANAAAARTANKIDHLQSFKEALAGCYCSKNNNIAEHMTVFQIKLLCLGSTRG